MGSIRLTGILSTIETDKTSPEPAIGVRSNEKEGKKKAKKKKKATNIFSLGPKDIVEKGLAFGQTPTVNRTSYLEKALLETLLNFALAEQTEPKMKDQNNL